MSSGEGITLPIKHETPWLCDVCGGEFPTDWMRPFKFNDEDKRACPDCADRIKTFINRFAATPTEGENQ